MKKVAPKGRSLDSDEPVHDRRHRMFANAKMEVFSAWAICLEVSCPLELQGGFVRGAKIGRAPEEPGNVLRQDVQHLARGIPPCDAFRVGRKLGEICVPSGRQLAPLHLVDFAGQFGILDPVAREQVHPPPPCGIATRANSRGKMFANAIGNQELRILRPAVSSFAKTDLLFAQRLAMGRRGILPVWRAVADVAVQDNEGGATLRLSEDLQGVLDAIDIVGVADPQNVPPVTQKAGCHVLGEGDARVSFDGDVVVIVDPAEVIQAQVARQ